MALGLLTEILRLIADIRRPGGCLGSAEETASLQAASILADHCGFDYRFQTVSDPKSIRDMLDSGCTYEIFAARYYLHAPRLAGIPSPALQTRPYARVFPAFSDESDGGPGEIEPARPGVGGCSWISSAAFRRSSCVPAAARRGCAQRESSPCRAGRRMASPPLKSASAAALCDLSVEITRRRIAPLGH